MFRLRILECTDDVTNGEFSETSALHPDRILLIASAAAAEITIPVAYLKQRSGGRRHCPILIMCLKIWRDGRPPGVAGKYTTGQFLGHAYTLETVIVPEGGDFAEAARQALGRTPFLILDAPATRNCRWPTCPGQARRCCSMFPAPTWVCAAKAAGRTCSHTLPSYRMRSDAVMQFAYAKRWTSLALITGTHAEDLTFADALRHSAEKFGLAIAAEQTWAFDADMRRNASQEVPLFTQELGDYDLLLIADELQDFGRYVSYNSWLPRPVAGSEGLSRWHGHRLSNNGVRPSCNRAFRHFRAGRCSPGTTRHGRRYAPSARP